MVEMKVYGLALDETSQVPVLVLKDLAEEQTLPIWIGAMEAMAISLVLNEVSLPRPMTHDLLLNLAEGVGGKVSRVEIVRLEGGTYYAEIEVDLGEEIRRIDSRPSDAVALALRAGCSIFVADEVLAEAARESADSRPEFKTEEASKWNDLLEQFSEDDNKYKM
ncbi:bifunctional nuclease family protein [Desulfovibrio ferrophilus]|uniref:BFN domain-containing protein n=1 Tax=Desulfovibrio ferrophilus TaxID=241368 RepID=A0A2Z6AYK3_9BACT|nr:bifunctional nuclease family protein [Desulfovibrio ferrophilus]BBD08341.1 uncharacterized protein DFE_1615 [Desulfovibrio ferrophilus]